MDGADILDLPMPENSYAAETVRDYLKAELLEVWRWGPALKRHHLTATLYPMLKDAGIGNVTDGVLDDSQFERLISEAILAL